MTSRPADWSSRLATFRFEAQGFFIVCPPATANSEKIAAFRNWVLEEAASSGS
jgi:hypothetical protein